MQFEPHLAFLQGLARAVARGGTIAGWAKRREIDVEVAREWSLMPEFRTMVDEARGSLCDRVAGKAARLASRAFDRLVELSERSGLTAVSVSATRGLIKAWLDVSVMFILQKRVNDLTAECEATLKTSKINKLLINKLRFVDLSVVSCTGSQALSVA